MAPPPIKPEMEPTHEAGWTLHNIEVRRQYTEYFELEILGGGMERDEVNEYLDEITQAVEANGGEARREAAAKEAAAEARSEAIAYKTVVQQSGMAAALDESGKGNGKTNSSFPKVHAPHRFNGCPQPARSSESINAINALVAKGRGADGQA